MRLDDFNVSSIKTANAFLQKLEYIFYAVIAVSYGKV